MSHIKLERESFLKLYQTVYNKEKYEPGPWMFERCVRACCAYVAQVHVYDATLADARERGVSTAEYSSIFAEQDKLRHDAHEEAITSTRILNRQSTRLGLGKVFNGDEENRYEIADFCRELVALLDEQGIKI